MRKETATQRVERLKKEKDGLSVLEDIKRYALSDEPIDPEDIDRFKWYGLYTQNKNLQDKDDNTTYFMLRTKLYGGANIEQLKCLVRISKDFGRDTADFTTRQALQIHFISVKNLPEIFTRLQNVGLTSIYAAGDVPRNIATCPIDGINHDAIYDTSKLSNQINKYLVGNKDFVNLPRKFKLGISGCNKHCIGHEIQDLSFSAARFDDEVFFDVSVGGGLGSNKKIALHIGYVAPNQVMEIVKIITTIYRDYGLRENRRKARLGHLIDDWGIKKFKTKVEESLGFELLQKNIINYTPYSKREHFGVHNSIVADKSYIGCAINGGKIGSDGLKKLITIMQNNNATTLRATNTQNFVITDVPNNQTENIVKELKEIDIEVYPSPFKARTISCTGMRFCKFAISETKNKAIEVVNHLEKTFPDFNETVSISLNGCPNSCAQPHMVDIGLLGAKVKDKDGNTVSGFELILNGNLQGDKSHFGRKIGIKFEEGMASQMIEGLIIEYKKSTFENIQKFLESKINEK
jgi:sulfite reductase (ferredoxin)